MSNLSRYIRQVRFAPFGEEGQRRLSQARALVCGCGALGSTIANHLVRAGVGHVRIVDRDFVDLTNLQRQSLFDEDDVAAALPKAMAAADKLRRINSSVSIEPVVADVDATNIERLCEGVDAIVDGTDNFETRFLINDLSVFSGIPWVYGGVVGGEGQSMTIVPGQTPCLRCLMNECPPPGSTPTCDAVGVLGPAVGVVASWQSGEAMKLLSGHRESISTKLTVVDLWEGRIRQVDLGGLRNRGDCPTCHDHEFPWLHDRQTTRSAVLCGRNSVQLSGAPLASSLDAMAERLRPLGELTRNAFLLRLKVDAYEITLFADGRAIIGGTDDPAVARTLYARYVGG
jgi:adenylyltransferase/sulfurtransferase